MFRFLSNFVDVAGLVNSGLALGLNSDSNHAC
jgi:hypothetical protein